MKNLTVPVVFEVELDSRRRGVVPRLIGSISELGFFEPVHGVDAKMVGKDSPIWQVKLDIPQRSFFFYNWVLMNQEEVVEEEEDHYRQVDVGVFGGVIKTQYGNGPGEFILDGGCTVSVTTKYDLSQNEAIAVVGSGDVFGNWAIASKFCSKSDTWFTDFDMKHGTTAEFKLVILDTDSGRIKKWQDGDNRLIKIEEGLNFKMVFVPWGGRFLLEGMVIPIIEILEYRDNNNEDEKMFSSAVLTLDRKALVGVGHGDGDGKKQETITTSQTSPRPALDLDLDTTVLSEVPSPRDAIRASYATEELPEESIFEAVWSSADAIDDVLMKLSCMTRERFSGSIGKVEETPSTPNEAGVSTGSSCPREAVDAILAAENLPEDELPYFETTWSSGAAIDYMLTKLSCMAQEELKERLDKDVQDAALNEEFEVKDRVTALEGGLARGMQITLSDDMVTELLTSQAASVGSEAEWSKPRKVLYNVFSGLQRFCNFVA